eukprot:NODE_559_length_1367_cov_196.391129_g523_i0.p2 GENE.NODE_559_length_1367_cov_196.391129_g523_i0~~NODE_559_length_1367_cov_196.391129_g523_i0.p2  ORF type:complete len:404 (+),score=141.37 NODE_559_length_1367_cov_196.391129_g523_i0:64-1275(+)
MMRLVVLLLAVGVASAGQWKDLWGFPWSGAPLELMTGIACSNKSMCYVTGSTGSSPFAIYYTKDNFHQVTEANMVGHTLMLLSMCFGSETNGVAAGVGALKDPGLLYTKDATTWEPAHDIALLTGQDVEPMAGGGFGFVGTTNAIFGGNGVLVSHDGGSRWHAHDWKKNLHIPKYAGARYGSFPTATTWYVSGGSWPGNNSVAGIHSFRKHFHMDMKTRKFLRGDLDEVAAEVGVAGPPTPPANGYYAVMTKTSDGGRTWTKQFESFEGFYFNDVNCFDEMTCIAVAEGFRDGPSPGARIFGTTDGGKKWTLQKKVFVQSKETSFMMVHMTSKTEAWVGGSSDKSQLDADAVFYHTTDGGKTWTQEASLKGVGALIDMTFVGTELGYATGITEVDKSTILQYS